MYYSPTLQGLSGVYAGLWQQAKLGGANAKPFLDLLFENMRTQTVTANPYVWQFRDDTDIYTVWVGATKYTSYSTDYINLGNFQSGVPVDWNTDPVLLHIKVCKNGEQGALDGKKLWSVRNGDWLDWNSYNNTWPVWIAEDTTCGGNSQPPSGGGTTNQTPTEGQVPTSNEPCPCKCYEVTKQKTLYLTRTNPGNGRPVSIKRRKVVCDLNNPPDKTYSWNCQDELARLKQLINSRGI